jgi:hypothetical protein
MAQPRGRCLPTQIGIGVYRLWHDAANPLISLDRTVKIKSFFAQLLVARHSPQPGRRAQHFPAFLAGASAAPTAARLSAWRQHCASHRLHWGKGGFHSDQQAPAPRRAGGGKWYMICGSGTGPLFPTYVPNFFGVVKMLDRCPECGVDRGLVGMRHRCVMRRVTVFFIAIAYRSHNSALLFRGRDLPGTDRTLCIS